jgi:hypothetical protein
MNDNEERSARPAVHSRGRMMDFAPRNAKNSVTVNKEPRALIDGEQRRRELAKREIERREEIHRQIEKQNQEDLIARRRAIAARRDLARRLEAEREENAEALAAREKEFELQREREEKARKRAMIEARALRERQRILAARRAKQAREELERRRRAEDMMRRPVARDFENPRGSRDPLEPVKRPIRVTAPEPVEPEEPEEEIEQPEEKPRRGLFRRNKVEKRLGSVEDFEAELDHLENETKKHDTTEEDIRDFVEDKKGDDFLDDIDDMERKVRAAEEDTSRNNARYVLGGRSPFINTEVEKRPLSGGNRTFESTASVASSPRSAARPKARGRYVPYDEPLPHKNIYARTLAKEKNNKDVPTMVVGDTPKGSKASLIIAIILTIILGATVGAIAYLALFQ